MEIQHLSTTLLQGWPTCPARAWKSYDTRLEHGDDQEGTEPTRFGTVVHTVAEKYHEAHMRGDDLPDPIQLFDLAWQANKAYDFEYYSLGRTKIEDFLNRTIHARRGDTIMTEIDFVMDLVSMDIYVVDSHEQRKQLVKMIIGRGGVPVASKIDRIDKVDDKTYEIFDYKTNFIPFTRWQVENSLQLGVYDLFVRKLFPQATEVVCVFDMIRHGRFPTEFDDQQRENLRFYLIDLWNQIKSETAPEERINSYCRWCERKNECKAYERARDEDPVIGTADDGDLDALFAKYEDLQARMKLIDSEATRIKEVLQESIKQNLAEPVQLSDDKEMYLQNNPMYEYPMGDVYKILQKKRALVVLKDIAKIGNTNLERLLKTRPDLKEEIAPLKRTSYKTPTLKARRIKKDRNESEESGGEDV